MGSKTLPIISSLYIYWSIDQRHFLKNVLVPMLEPCCRERLAGVECSPHEREAQGGGGGGGGGGGEDFTDAALDTAGAEQRAAYEAAVVAHEEEEVRTVRSTVPRGVYIHRKVGEMEEME